MNVTMLVLLIVAGVLLVAGFAVGLVVVMRCRAAQLSGDKGGWRRLAETHGTSELPAGHISKPETIQVGAVTYDRCVTLGIADDGLYISILGTTALIQWAEFKAVAAPPPYEQQVRVLTVGDPPVATLTVPVAVFQMLRGRLPVGLA